MVSQQTGKCCLDHVITAVEAPLNVVLGAKGQCCFERALLDSLLWGGLGELVVCLRVWLIYLFASASASVLVFADTIHIHHMQTTRLNLVTVRKCIDYYNDVCDIIKYVSYQFQKNKQQFVFTGSLNFGSLVLGFRCTKIYPIIVCLQ